MINKLSPVKFSVESYILDAGRTIGKESVDSVKKLKSTSIIEQATVTVFDSEALCLVFAAFIFD